MNAPEMNSREREALEQELLELHFDCHPEPERLRARLHEPEVAALWQRVQELGQTLHSAAREPAAPVAALTSAKPKPRSARGLWRTPVYAAAAALAITGLAGAVWGAFAWRHSALRAQHVALTVSGPTAVPHAAQATYVVRGRDLDDRPASGSVQWRLLDAAGKELQRGDAPLTSGDARIELPARLEARHALVVAMATPRGPREISFPLAPTTVPMVHVGSDKPIYRPGETVRLRAVALDRVALAPLAEDVPLRLRILDARDACVLEQPLTAQANRHGVGEAQWSIGEDLAGGRFRAQVTRPDDTEPLGELALHVQRFEPPRFKKDVALDQPSYAPGGKGAADVAIERLGGGSLAGADAIATLLIGDEEVWRAQSKLDAQGRARFAFVLPEVARAGAARFAVRVDDGSTTETEVEAFTVSGGRAHLAAYPEGGDLVAGVESRVYVAATDPQGAPLQARGRLVDGSGREVATFTTAHRGHGAFAFTPQADATYAIELLGTTTARTELPRAQTSGLVLRALDERIAAGAPLRVRIAGRGTERVRIGVFCRGTLVGQSATPLEGSAEVSIPLPDAVCGVLRVTAFAEAGEQLAPLAERLVQRAAKQRLTIELAPQRAELTPGSRQAVQVRVRDEAGLPVVAALGLSVTDQSVRALRGEQRVTLVDEALLCTDLPELSDGAALAAAEPAQIDLLLGTAGWRRFAWREAPAVAEVTPSLLRTQRREGRVDTAAVHTSAASRDDDALYAAQRQQRRWSFFTTAAGVLGAALVLVLGFACAVVAIARRREWSTTLPADVAFGALAAIVLVAPTMLFLQPQDGLAPTASALRGVVFGELDDTQLDTNFRWFASADRAGQPPIRLPFDLGPGGWNDFYLSTDQLRSGSPVNVLYSMHAGLVRGAPEQSLRVFAHQARQTGTREDFTETVLWSPLVVTDAQGHAEVAFDVSDRVTTWVIDADGHAPGRLGTASATFTSTQPFHLEAKLPIEATEGDELLLPIALVAKDPAVTAAELKVEVSGSLRQRDGIYRVAALQDGRGRLRVPVTVQAAADAPSAISLEGSGATPDGAHRDRIRQDVRVMPRGFPHARSWSDVLAAESQLDVPMPATTRRARALLRMFPSPLATLGEGLDGMLQEPTGCFEQTSSSNYPNLLVLSYLQESGDVLPAVASRARELLDRGYRRLTGFECKQGGYEWFGADPAHLELTAYGLLQFTDMASVHEVDAAMVERTRNWLLGRRNGQGSFSRPTSNHHSFGSAPTAVADAYCLWALLYSGSEPRALEVELTRARERAAASKDAYELALLANALRQAKDAAAPAARARLVELQSADGSLVGSTTSITGSRGDDLAVETSALAALAWLGESAHAVHTQLALRFVQSKRHARGTFGATQATVLALRALTDYAQQRQRTDNSGEFDVLVRGTKVRTVTVRGSEIDAIELDLTAHLAPGDNAVALVRRATGGAAAEPWPWALTLTYHADQPADDDAAVVALRTSVFATAAKEGDIVVVDVELENSSGEGLPMTMAVIGLPAGLELPARELDTLKGTGHFDFYELRGREVILYWRGLGPNQTYRLQLATVARIPGISTGPASRAYLYYQPDVVRWAPPLRVEIK